MELIIRSSTSLFSVKKGFLSRCWCCTNVWMSRLKDSLLGHSGDCVASSHFSNKRASSGNSGCLDKIRLFQIRSHGFPICYSISQNQTSTGLYRSCAALASFSGTLILFQALYIEFIVEKVWFGLVSIDGLNKQTKQMVFGLL